MTLIERMMNDMTIQTYEKEAADIVASVKAGDFESLRNALRQLGVDDLDIDELEQIVAPIPKVERPEDV